DLGGDWKKSGPAGGGNVFGIGTGVAIGFWVRKRSPDVKRKAEIKYIAASSVSGDEKLSWLNSLIDDGRTFDDIEFEEIVPKDGYWIDHPVEDLVGLPIASKDVKSNKRGTTHHAIFFQYSLGISTNRDEWLYDFDRKRLNAKARLLVAKYNEVRPGTKNFPDTIKWSETLKRRKLRASREEFSSRFGRRAAYRPFVEKW